MPELHQLSVELCRGSGHRRQAAGGAAAAAALLSAACCRRSRRAQLRVQVLGLGDGDPLSSKVVGVEAAKLSGDLGELIEEPRPTAATCMTEADGRGVPVSAEAFIHLPVAMCGGEEDGWAFVGEARDSSLKSKAPFYRSCHGIIAAMNERAWRSDGLSVGVSSPASGQALVLFRGLNLKGTDCEALRPDTFCLRTCARRAEERKYGP